MNQSDLRKWIEACRSEADLTLPEAATLSEKLESDPQLRRTWDRVRRQDEMVRAALQQVAVPDGLKERILLQLEQTAASAVASSAQSASISLADAAIDAAAEGSLPGEIGVSPRSPPNHLHRRQLSTRWRWWISSLVGLAAIVVCAFTIFRQPASSIDNEMELVRDWVGSLRETEWSNASPPLRTFPLPAQLAARPFQWQALAGGRGTPQVVCYELSSTGQRGPRAWLFVVATVPRPSLASHPPHSPYPVPPWSVGVWKGPSAVYVLVAQGGTDQYRRLLHFGASPVAGWMPRGKSFLVGKVHSTGTRA
jgi:hypothetical protein